MSKKVGAGIVCSQCGQETPTQLYRSLWLEDPKNMKMVCDDHVNVFSCPHCLFSERLKFPFLATNRNKKYAVWYEPYRDEAVDADVADYKKHMGPTSYLALAPRIADWEDFKAKIEEFEDTKSPDRPSGVDLSPEMNTAFESFVSNIEVQNSSSDPKSNDAVLKKSSINYWKWSVGIWLVLSIIFIALFGYNVWVGAAILNQLIVFGAAIPLSTFILMLSVRWFLRRFPPNKYSQTTKKIIAGVVTWELAAYAWIIIYHSVWYDYEYGTIEVVFAEEFQPYFVLPPIVIIVGGVLWGWANKEQEKA